MSGWRSTLTRRDTVVVVIVIVVEAALILAAVYGLLRAVGVHQ